MRRTNIPDIGGREPLAVPVGVLAGMLGCGQQTAKKIGTAAGARVQLGKRVVFRLDRVREYLDTVTEGAGTC